LQGVFLQLAEEEAAMDAPHLVCSDRDEDEVSVVELGEVSFEGCFVAGAFLGEVVKEGEFSSGDASEVSAFFSFLQEALPLGVVPLLVSMIGP
jgi:hypothetical protein